MALDPTRLTSAEQTELATLASRVGQLPDDRWNFAGLDDAALNRLAALVGKGEDEASAVDDACNAGTASGAAAHGADTDGDAG